MVRRVDSRGIITTFAGTEAGLAGDGGPANRAQISLPTAVSVAPDGSIAISDAGNNRLRRVDRDGRIETLLGTGPGSGTAGAGFGGVGWDVRICLAALSVDELTAVGSAIASLVDQLIDDTR